MILLIPIFILVLVFSFWLAKLSMRDYQEGAKDTKRDYGLYLIRNSPTLSVEVLRTIYEKLALTDGFLSIERLLKGRESALVIFGLRSILAEFVPLLSLIELEDFTKVVNKTNLSVAELGVKIGGSSGLEFGSIFMDIEPLGQEEQLWLQLVLRREKNTHFGTLIRVAVLANNQLRRKQILDSIIKTPFVKIPKPYSVEQMIGFYQQRALSLDKDLLKVSPTSILKLISLKR